MQRKRFSIFSMLVFVLFHGVMAHATPITAPIAAGTYNLVDASILAGTVYSLTGTVTIGSNGLMTAADVILNDANLGNPVFNVISNTGGPAGYAPVADYAYLSTTGNIGQLYLSYLTTLDALGNLDLCISGKSCNGYQASTLQIYSNSGFGYDPVRLRGGSFDPTPVVVPDPAPTVTPEPASLLLLATGLLGLAGLFWRRKMRA